MRRKRRRRTPTSLGSAKVRSKLLSYKGDWYCPHRIDTRTTIVTNIQILKFVYSRVGRVNCDLKLSAISAFMLLAQHTHKNPPHETPNRPGLILSIPYGASIGGIATLTGTPPNLVFKAAFEQAFPDAPGVDYGTWMGFAYPISLMVVLAGWHILVIMYARRRWVVHGDILTLSKVVRE